MKKLDKTIHIRISDTVYDLIGKKAEEHQESVSGYSRKVLEESVDLFTGYLNPFDHDDFNHLIQWIYNMKSYYHQLMIFDAKHYLAILEKYYPFLDINIRMFLDVVKFDLEKYIEQYEKEKEDPNGYYLLLYDFSFCQKGDPNYFEYTKFLEYIRRLDWKYDKYLDRVHYTITL